MKVTLLCDACSWTYRMNIQPGRYDVGELDPLCTNKTNPGVLVLAPSDAIPGTFYDPSKDDLIRCEKPVVANARGINVEQATEEAMA